MYEVENGEREPEPLLPVPLPPVPVAAPINIKKKRTGKLTDFFSVKKNLSLQLKTCLNNPVLPFKYIRCNKVTKLKLFLFDHLSYPEGQIFGGRGQNFEKCN
jgi:hypothetical protein